MPALLLSAMWSLLGTAGAQPCSKASSEVCVPSGSLAARGGRQLFQMMDTLSTESQGGRGTSAIEAAQFSLEALHSRLAEFEDGLAAIEQGFERLVSQIRPSDEASAAMERQLHPLGPQINDLLRSVSSLTAGAQQHAQQGLTLAAMGPAAAAPHAAPAPPGPEVENLLQAVSSWTADAQQPAEQGVALATAQQAASGTASTFDEFDARASDLDQRLDQLLEKIGHPRGDAGAGSR